MKQEPSITCHKKEAWKTGGFLVFLFGRRTLIFSETHVGGEDRKLTVKIHISLHAWAFP
jgi:hypothetical protein